MDHQIVHRRTDAIENAERVLAAALELYDERGIQAEVREIAARAGVGVGTVYRNFPTKDDLTNAVLIQLFEKWRLELAAIETDDDPINALTLVLAHHLEIVRRHAWMLEFQMRPSMLHDSTLAKLSAMLSLQHETLQRLVARAIERGDFRPGLNISLVASLLSAAGHPQVYARAGSGASAEDLARSLLALLREGIGA